MTDIVVQQHFVTFCSPGTFVAETSSKPIHGWDIDAAKEMALTIEERHGATPYGFYFTTNGRGEKDLDSKEIAKSPFYWLGGKIETLAEVEARNDPKEEILRSNMRGNGYDKIIVNTNSYKFTAPFFEEGHVLLDFTPPKRAA